MQIKRLHKNIYKLASYALSQEKCDELRKQIEKGVRNWERLKQSGVSDPICQITIGISRATYYRHKQKLCDLAKGIPPLSKRPKSIRRPAWGEREKQQVLYVRRENPTYGKAKIAVILKRDHHLLLSQSTVGRILKALKDKGLIQTSLSALRKKRKRTFKSHAKPWKYGMKGQKIGQLVQIDHMSVCKNGLSIKHFQAWDPTSKYIFAKGYSRATSMCAKQFLLEFIEKSAFPIISIQVDGGSEFMRHFEEVCEELKIDLYVLPPQRSQYNGGVERGNRIFREEFYARNDLLADSIGAMNAELKKALLKYNSYRPHHSLNMMTPLEYIYNTYLKAA